MELKLNIDDINNLTKAVCLSTMQNNRLLKKKSVRKNTNMEEERKYQRECEALMVKLSGENYTLRQDKEDGKLVIVDVDLDELILLASVISHSIANGNEALQCAMEMNGNKKTINIMKKELKSYESTLVKVLRKIDEDIGKNG